MTETEMDACGDGNFATIIYFRARKCFSGLMRDGKLLKVYKMNRTTGCSLHILWKFVQYYDKILNYSTTQI